MSTDTQPIAIDSGFDEVEIFEVSKAEGAAGAEFKRLVRHIVSRMSLNEASKILAEFTYRLGFDPLIVNSMIEAADKEALPEFDCVVTDRNSGREHKFSIRRNFSKTFQEYVRLIEFAALFEQEFRVSLWNDICDTAGDRFLGEILRRLSLANEFISQKKTSN